MTNDVKKVPELRFPEFSGEWEEKMLGDVLTILDGDRGKNYPSGSDFLEYGHTLFLNASNVTKNGFSFTLKQYITEKKSISMGNGKLVKDDVVLTTRGSIGNIGWYDEEIYREIPYARINSGMLILRSNNKDMASFVSQFLMSTKGKRQIDRISFGSAQPQLTKKDIKLYRIDFPQIKEQQKIGEFFSKLDRQIELEEQKLEKLEEQKKGYMQKIFSQELRFKDGNGNNYSEWIKTNLKFLVSYKNGKGYEKEVVQNGKYNIINLNSISTKGMLKDSGKYSDFEDITLKKNDLIMILSDVAKGNLIGKTAIIDQDDKYLLNQRVASLRIKDESTSNVLFIYYFINYFRQYFINMSTGMSQLNINKSTVEDFLIYLPYIEEQDKIGNFFSNLDKSIIKQLDKIELLKERKKGFLQKMFV